MNKSYKFFIDAKNGKVTWSNMIAVVRSLWGSDLVITIEQKRPRLSSQQRAYVHAVIGYMADYVGTTPEDLKNDIKIRIGLVQSKFVDGKLYTIITSTEDLDKQQYSLFIEETLNVARALSNSDAGFQLPEPKYFGFDYN